MSTEEKKITFSFSKIKKPNLNETTTVSSATKTIFENKKTIIKTSKSYQNNRRYSNSDSDESSDNEKDLVTEIVGKKVKSTKPREEKKLPIIELKNSKRSAEDLDAIRALIEGSSNKKSKISSIDLKIESNEKKNDDDEEKEEEIDDPDYEKIQLDDFGLACLRGMGWSEKEGIGKTNKQIVKMAELELRPRGLGLGAAFAKKKKDDNSNNNNEDDESNLNFVKGAYLKVLNGKFENKYAQLVSFDDGLNRILIKIEDTGETISILQSLTELVSKKNIINMFLNDVLNL